MCNGGKVDKRRPTIPPSRVSKRVRGGLPFPRLALCIVLRIVLNAIEKGKGLCFVVVVFAIVFLSMSMGLDLDCCVPYPAPSPKKFTVFRGSGSLCFGIVMILLLC